LFEKKRKTTQAVKITPHMKLRKSKPLCYRIPENSFTANKKEKAMGIKRVAGLA
jgi:hypothetical protein